VQPKASVLSDRELEIATRAFRWALYAMADTCEATGEPPGRVLNVILSEEGWEQKLKQKLETWLEIQAEVTDENARRANAETSQPATERREEPQQQTEDSNERLDASKTYADLQIAKPCTEKKG